MMRKLYWEMNLKMQMKANVGWTSTFIAMDSTALMFLATSARVSARNKHIDIKCHHTRELLKSGLICLSFVRSKFQTADVLEKIVPINFLSCYCSLLSLLSA